MGYTISSQERRGSFLAALQSRVNVVALGWNYSRVDHISDRHCTEFPLNHTATSGADV